MNFKKYKIFVFLGIIFIFFLKTASAFALELSYPEINVFGTSLSINDTSGLPEYARYFFSIGVALAGFIAVAVIAFGGIFYLVSYGRGKFTDEAKEWIRSGILGLLLVVCAYLIVHTINPELVIFKLPGLPYIGAGKIIDFSGSGAKITTYKEIPIGILTENVLTKTTNCYAFDPEGNPIDGDRTETDDGETVLGPTYLERDRIDCLALLIDGAQKKAKIAGDLSDAIYKLMDTCDCEASGKCGDCPDNSCSYPEGLACPVPRDPFGNLPFDVDERCDGTCKKSPCKQLRGTQDSCPDGVKDKIEHGPIKIGGASSADDCGSASTSGSESDYSCEQCNTPEREYKGLDEFRCTVCSNIISLVEKQVKIDGKTINLIDKEKWRQLNLIQQLIYFKEKISQIKQKILNDAKKLEEAKTMLSSRSCYLAKSYIDLLKSYEQTKKENRIILSEKSFYDSESSRAIDISKYCKGYNYANSSCFKKCNDACPDTSAIDGYKSCENCRAGDLACKSRQQECIKKAYNLRPCPFGSGSFAETEYINFEGCMASCQTDCADSCSKKYLSCSKEYSLCINQCQDDSRCISENKDKCLFGFEGLKFCSTQITDSGNVKNCIDDAYLCKNGSDQFAGYLDCVKNISLRDYSSSYLYMRPQEQKCPKPYEPAEPGPICYNSENPKASCQDLCLETAKCPAASDCPDCPCDKVDETIEFLIPNLNNGKNAECEGCSPVSQKVKAYRVVGPECNEYSYNDDPLTFYCENNWLKNQDREGQSETPIGQERKCQKNDEIPVGLTVDNTLSWVSKTLNSTENAEEKIKNIVLQIQKIGRAIDTPPINDYCKCNAQDEAKKPLCKAGCKFNQTQVPIFGIDPDTGEIILIGEDWECTCTPTPCKGKPCKQMMDYLKEVWNIYRQLKIDYIDLYVSLRQEGRSDILKELSYSRQKTNECSLTNDIYGKETTLFSCTRVEDELMPDIIPSDSKLNPKNYYCYGKHFGNLSNINLMDNWFCCQTYK